MANIPKTLKEDWKRIERLFQAAINVTDRNDRDHLPYYLVRIYEKYLTGLFQLSKFSEGDRVRLVNEYSLDKEKSPGYWCYRHLFVPGSTATVKEVDFEYGGRKPTFVYLIQFDKNTWIDSEGVVRESTSGPSCFYLAEEELDYE